MNNFMETYKLIKDDCRLATDIRMESEFITFTVWGDRDMGVRACSLIMNSKEVDSSSRLLKRTMLDNNYDIQIALRSNDMDLTVFW